MPVRWVLKAQLMLRSVKDPSKREVNQRRFITVNLARQSY